MFSHALKCVLFLVTVSSINSQNNESTSTTASPNLQRSFTEPFRSSVRSSPHIFQVFDTNYPSSQASANFFQAYQDAMKNINAQYPVSLGKAIADAIYMTLPVLTQESFMSVVILSMTRYLISQNLLNVDNAEANSKAFFAALVNNYPQEKDLSHFNLNRALSNAIVEFLNFLGDSAVQRVAAFSINLATYFFAFAPVSKPSVEVTVVSLPGTIPSAEDVYGITLFTSTFMSAVDSSLALQEIFYVDLSVNDLGKAWHDAADAFCNSIGCPYSRSGDFQISIQRTYNFMSKNTYVKSVSSAFAMMLLELGKLSKDASYVEAENVVEIFERLVEELPSTANLQDRLGVVFGVFNDIVGAENDVMNLFSAFCAHIIMEFYAVTPVVVHPDISLNKQ